jgi:hypothetical protein
VTDIHPPDELPARLVQFPPRRHAARGPAVLRNVDYGLLRVASFRDVTELLIVVLAERRQDLCDILGRQLVRLDTIW